MDQAGQPDKPRRHNYGGDTAMLAEFGKGDTFDMT
jgi:hypothetical protein